MRVEADGSPEVVCAVEIEPFETTVCCMLFKSVEKCRGEAATPKRRPHVEAFAFGCTGVGEQRTQRNAACGGGVYEGHPETCSLPDDVVRELPRRIAFLHADGTVVLMHKRMCYREVIERGAMDVHKV